MTKEPKAGPPLDKACATCAYWDNYVDPNSGRGFCRYRAPMNANVDSGGTYVWPITLSTDWCEEGYLLD